MTLNPGKTKNDEGRPVSLDNELREIFERQLEARKQAQKKTQKILPYVFLNKDGTDRIKRFDKSWNKGCASAGIERNSSMISGARLSEIW